MNRLFLSAAGTALLAATPALAEIDQVAAAPSVADRTAATSLDDIVVTANRSAQAVERVAASVTVLNRAALEATQATSVPEAIARTAGVSVTRNGDIGTATTVNIRGAEGHHTVVLIDGVKMNDPSSTQGGTNLSNLLVGDVARIEVLRGAQSTLWGSQAIGGVVNIITAEPTAPFQGSLSAEAGSRGTTNFRGAVGGQTDRVNWRIGANRFDTDGFSAYAPGNEKDGYTNTTLSGRFNVKLTNNVSVDLRAVYSDGVSDFDGWGVDSREHGVTEELVTYAGLNFDLLDGRFRNRIGYSYTDTQRSNINPDRSIQTTTFEAKGENKRWEYQGAFAFTDNLKAAFGLESERAEMRSRSPQNSTVMPEFGTGRADLDSAYLQLQWNAFAGLNLTAGVRYDDNEQFGGHSLGQVAAAWSLNEGATVLRASWGQGFRAPGLYELYSEYGNLDLQPEQFDSWEIGVQQKFSDSASVSVTYFNRQADNEIRYYSCSFTSPDPMCTVNDAMRWGYYANIQETKAQGVEVSGQLNLTPALLIAGNYTWTEALNASGVNKGRTLVRRPEHMANLSADYAFASGLKTGVAVRYTGETFTNEANTGILDEYAIVDLRVSYPLNENLDLYGRVENLFEENYVSVPDYGTAGRGVFGGVRIRF